MSPARRAALPVDSVPPTEFLEPDSDFFSTAAVEYCATVRSDSNGDLWPSCWADDDAIYAVNGDGQGFDTAAAFADVVVNRITGRPETGIAGARLAAGNAVARTFADPASYNPKPTGMLAVDGNHDGYDELYLSIQDLRSEPGGKQFNDAPNASICVSTDYGRSWRSTEVPMFGGHVFTTIMFLDFGRSGEHASVLGADGSRFAYAYGLDGNWRDSYSQTAPSPHDLYLARVPIESIQDRARWQFYRGEDGNGGPLWSSDIAQRKPVLHDARTIYPQLQRTTAPNSGPSNLSVLSQGGVVYNAGLRRYIYTSWTEYTFEFYEAPMPWGPWRLFLTKDFGGYPWFGPAAQVTTRAVFGHRVPSALGRSAAATPGPKNGGYGCTVPSKFISGDGRSMWVQSNWFVGVGGGAPNYDFSLRKFDVTPHQAAIALNPPDPLANLARSGAGVVTIEKSAHYGHGAYYNDGNRELPEDSWDNTDKTVDFWGYHWAQPYRLNEIVYTTGTMFRDGGWFASGLTVQVRQRFRWVTVSGLTISPDYPYNPAAGSGKTYTLRFADTWGDGVRIIGAPGGSGHFTSIAELEVYFNLR